MELEMPPFRTLLNGTVVTLSASATLLLVAQAALLPATSCLVDRETVEGLAMPQSYADVRDKLGCQGELAGREDWGPIVRETYRWRGNAWPFGRFAGVFYNGQMHGKEVRWISLNLSWHDPRPDPAQARTSE
jgi:hypothetical protein